MTVRYVTLRYIAVFHLFVIFKVFLMMLLQLIKLTKIHSFKHKYLEIFKRSVKPAGNLKSTPNLYEYHLF